MYPFDISAGMVMLAMIFAELYYAHRSLRQMIKRQTTHFLRLCQAESDNNSGASEPLLGDVG